eukprot:772802-Rhodomonas_salina.1
MYHESLAVAHRGTRDYTGTALRHRHLRDMVVASSEARVGSPALDDDLKLDDLKLDDLKLDDLKRDDLKRDDLMMT